MEYFEKHKSNIRYTWSAIKYILRKFKLNSELPSYFVIGDSEVNNSYTIANRFIGFLVNVLSSIIDNSNDKTMHSHLKQRITRSFNFQYTLITSQLKPVVGWVVYYNDVIMGALASQITSLTIVYSDVYSDADQRKHQRSASLAFMRGILRWLVNSPHKWPVTRKMLPFDDVIMISSKLLQRIKGILVDMVTVINSSLCTGVFPDNPKFTKVVPLTTKHYDDVKWLPMRPELPANRAFVQQFVHTDNKETSKVLDKVPLWEKPFNNVIMGYPHILDYYRPI